MLGQIIADAPLAAGPEQAVAAPAALLTLYSATEDFETSFGETPENTLFPGTLLSPLRVERSLVSGLLGGTVAVSYGEAELVGVDRTYDDIVQDFDVAGRPIEIKVGAPDWRFADFITLFDGTASGWRADEDKLIVQLRGWEFLLEVAFESRTFAGTGGLAGTSDLEGKRIPVALGWLKNVTPAFVIPNELLFQVHGGQVSDIPFVYVRGAALNKGPDYPTPEALRAATVPANSFITCLAAGLFRVEYLNDQEKGAVTCDVKGAVIGGVFLETTAQIIGHILQDRGAVPAVRIASLSGAPWQFHRPVGFYAGPEDSSTCADVTTKLLRGCCGWGGFSRKGLFSLGSVRLAAGPAVGIYEEPDIKSVVPVDLPDELATPPWRWRVGYDRNWTVQTNDLAGLVIEDRKKWLKEEQRLAEITNPTTKAFYQKPGDPDPVDAYFRDRDDAQRLAEELEILWRSPRGLYRVTLGNQAFARELGDVVQITYPRWRLKLAPSATVVAISEDAEDDQSEMTVLVA
ncbi:hypothetical protein GBZ48_31535 [Azospirillum melinis]|uniref:Tip attachment protein J domain-containing protein n=1 Tax=Azospirillum melinis TaxID=328839 RepID=A0ABX2KJG5_9PROT|nr:hypothetical protein [Azospirillum melinis]MBP2310490.1 hypothetical protein [Azospirillum melinis]NUB03750.1 hypothetical protein [Azospirillum melinis]